MIMRRWLLGCALVAGCASSSFTPRDVAQLPRGEQGRLESAQGDVTVARQSLATARLERDDAVQFRRVADNELASARSSLAAARTAIAMAHGTRDMNQLQESERNESMARQARTAAQAKLDYADRLLAERDARIDVADKRLKLAQADRELETAKLVVNRGINGNVDLGKYQARRDGAAARLSDSQAKVAVINSEAQHLRATWRMQRNAYDVATRDNGTPPLAPPSLRERAVDPPRGDVNDTPGSAEIPESQSSGPLESKP